MQVYVILRYHDRSKLHEKDDLTPVGVCLQLDYAKAEVRRLNDLEYGNDSGVWFEWEDVELLDLAKPTG